ncbi:hypothetical protein ANN_05876 [Periplaneta americana]|uniref:Uncharacterized protein n=1 Tax=Periplaneta americana TaxID=6978 RepID=A0ABQ8TC05_PERAM|nr:hypothetical protein ANN_05876 [Periplaneta americana]
MSLCVGKFPRSLQPYIRAGICPERQTDGNKTDLTDELPAGETENDRKLRNKVGFSGDVMYPCADKNSIKYTTMRVLLFQTIAPGIPLPPQPVLTHWGTWLNAVNYYAEHYSKIMEVIDALDSTDSSAVAAVKSLPSEQLLEDILFIDSNFKIVSKSITLLESSKLKLSDALNIVDKVSQTVIQNNNSLISEKLKHERAVLVQRSFRRRLADNRGRGPVPTSETVLSWVKSGGSQVQCARSMTFVPRKKSILSRLRTSHNSEVEEFKYLGATVTNINDTREEIKPRINMGNACYYSVEKLLSSSLLSKNLKVRIYKTVILPVVLCGCETWTLTLREEQRLRVFENKILRKIFGAKRDEVTGEWRKLHNTELHALYSSPDIIRNIKSRSLRWAEHVARMGESRNAYRVLVGRPEGKRPLGRPRRRWEDNIKMDLREVGYDDRDWINPAQDRDKWRAYVRAAMNLRLP